MARPKKPKYEYVAALGRYRKRIKDTDGKYVAIYGRTPEELEAKLRDAEQLIEAAAFNRETPTVEQYAAQWMALHEPYIRPRTAIDYRSIIKNHIVGVIGGLRMCDVRPSDAKRVAAKVAAMSASVYDRTYMLMRQIFGAALDDGLIQTDPTVSLPTSGGQEAAERKALDDEEVETLLDAIKGLPVEVFIYLGLYAGLRREEILGLQWSNVHLAGETPYLSVRTACHWEHNRPIIDVELKTKAAKRDIPIPPQLATILRQVNRTGNTVIADRHGLPLTETQFRNMWHAVTCRQVKERSYTKYINGQKIKKTIVPQLGQRVRNRNYCYTIAFDVTPHILRHTYITNLLLAGVDVKTVQYLAGHERAKITLDIYAHLTYNRPEDLAVKVNQAFEVKNEVKNPA